MSATSTLDIFTSVDRRTQDLVYRSPCARGGRAEVVAAYCDPVAWSRFLVARRASVA